MMEWIPPWARRRALLVVSVTISAVLVIHGCLSPSPPQPIRQAPLKSVRQVRVLIQDSVSTAQIAVAGPFVIRSYPPQNARDHLFEDENLEWSACRVAPDKHIELAGRNLGHRAIEIIPANKGALRVARWMLDNAWSAPTTYDGGLRLIADGRGGIDLINIVDLESYVAGVLPGELYADFHESAFQAQAITARTYALYQMSQRIGADYDVVAGEGSQVYIGASAGETGSKARRAVNATSGVVCAWDSPNGERIFCTYYSSCCGGITSPYIEPGQNRPILPLSGLVNCQFCQIAKGNVYQWGPVQLPKGEISAKLRDRALWPPTASELNAIGVAGRSSDGRVDQLEVIDVSGNRFRLDASDVRLALGSHRIRSTAYELVDEGRTVRFENGRGFGHGMGLCQWGMQGQALNGKSASQIIRFYYPGVKLVRIN
jgi:stage II sporulation protein D